MTALDEIIRANRVTGGPALPSVCSAHPEVLVAALLLAEELDRPLLIEATSNQVNHQGGYTGMSPDGFVARLREIARQNGVDADRLLFGGDHLGPQAWKSHPADQAMAEAREMIKGYVGAGFTKIHLDCSEGCAGEPPAMSDEVAAARAADLATVAEGAALAPDHLRYVIGTEVPPPGGAHRDGEGLTPTPPDRAAATLVAHRDAFARQGLGDAFTRVRALVVQPGLEFAPGHIDHFPTDAPDDLSGVLAPYPDLCFEAHSTDYQYDVVFPELARRHFAILKVGPALTFAWREALYALSHCDQWQRGTAHISEVMERLMCNHPENWQSHYHGSPETQRWLRHFGYADRIRYYWARPEASEAVAALKTRLAEAPPPAPLLRQYLPAETLERAEGLGLPLETALPVAHVQRALRPYFCSEA